MYCSPVYTWHDLHLRFYNKPIVLLLLKCICPSLINISCSYIGILTAFQFLHFVEFVSSQKEEWTFYLRPPLWMIFPLHSNEDHFFVPSVPLSFRNFVPLNGNTACILVSLFYKLSYLEIGIMVDFVYIFLNFIQSCQRDGGGGVCY